MQRHGAEATDQPGSEHRDAMRPQEFPPPITSFGDGIDNLTQR
jgi:hypothetical protein